MLFAFPIVWCLAGKFLLSHYDTENERGSIAPQDGVGTARNNIQNVDIGGWWQPDCMETSQTIYLTSTSKTIMRGMENDKETTLAEICLCLFGVRAGKQGEITNWVLLFFFALLRLSFWICAWIKEKKITYQYEQENNRWCKVLRWGWKMPGASHSQPQPVTVSGRLSLFAILSGRFSKRLRKISPLNKQTWICRRTNYCI